LGLAEVVRWLALFWESLFPLFWMALFYLQRVETARWKKKAEDRQAALDIIEAMDREILEKLAPAEDSRERTTSRPN
jgi:hypothetical protein